MDTHTETERETTVTTNKTKFLRWENYVLTECNNKF